MFFKNLLAYHVNLPGLTAESLEEKLGEHRSEPCQRLESARYGFVSPFSGSPDGVLVHSAAGHMLFTFQIEEKVLPSSVVRDAVQEKVEAIQTEEGRTVFRKERAQIKDEVMLDLLPRAFTKKTHINAFITASRKYLVINTASHPKAEDLMSWLRTALGTLPALPLKVKASPSGEMTRWIDNSGHYVPAGFTTGRSCELRSTLEAGSAIRCKDIDLDGDEVQQCL
jgi:recombination associated protein RdgC